MNKMNELKMILSGLIFLSGDEGLSLQQMKLTIQDYEIDDLKKALFELMDEYLKDYHGFELVCFGGVYKFVSKASIHSYAQNLFATMKANTLSNAALETLAIIAYKQPITRVEIEEIRGVSCDMMIRKLMARGLIKECGRSDAIGRPFLYEVTQQFLDQFKLTSLNDLPQLPQLNQNQKVDLFED